MKTLRVILLVAECILTAAFYLLVIAGSIAAIAVAVKVLADN